MRAEDRVADLFARAHRLSDRGDVRVVPRVVVHQRGPIGHAADLVPVVPPGHDFGIWRRILPQPVIRLAVVVDDVLAPVRQSAGKDHRRRRVGVGCDPGAVQDEQKKIHGDHADD